MFASLKKAWERLTRRKNSTLVTSTAQGTRPTAVSTTVPRPASGTTTDHLSATLAKLEAAQARLAMLDDDALRVAAKRQTTEQLIAECRRKLERLRARGNP